MLTIGGIWVKDKREFFVVYLQLFSKLKLLKNKTLRQCSKNKTNHHAYKKILLSFQGIDHFQFNKSLPKNTKGGLSWQSPVVKNMHFHCRGHGFGTWSGN